MIQLSNTNVFWYKLFVGVICGVFILVFGIIEFGNLSFGRVFNFPIPHFYLVLLFTLVFYYQMFGQYYKVLFDDEYLYYSNLFVKKKIPLGEVERMTIASRPVRLFVSIAYTIYIYTKNGKKIKCLSRELDFNSKSHETTEYRSLQSNVRKLNKAAQFN